MTTRLWLAALLFLAAPACKKENAATPAAADAHLRDLMEQLDQESKQRASGTPSPEKVFDALTAEGLGVDRRKQVLAATVKASYCEGGFIAASGVVVCEYPTAEAAAAGQTLAAERAKGAEILVNKKTTLALTGGDAPLLEKVKAAFEKL